MNASNQNVQFKKSDLANGKIYSASVRTDGNNVSGQGKFAEFHFKLKAGLPENSSVVLALINSKMIGNSGLTSTISTSGSSAFVSSNLVGLTKTNHNGSEFNLFPNPTDGLLHLQSSSKENVFYRVTNLLGQDVVSGDFKDSHQIDLSLLPPGSYLVTFKTSEGLTYKKFILE